MHALDFKDKSELEATLINDTKVSNKLEKKLTQEVIRNVLAEMREVVAHTLGPYGTSNFIQTIDGKPATVFSTKDGFEAINNIRYTEPLPNAIRDSLKDLAYHMQKTVGDGTTSGYPIVEALYAELTDNKDANTREILSKMSPVGICNVLDAIYKYFEENIFNNPAYVKSMENMTTDEKIEVIKKVAAISANNDYQIAETVIDVFKNKLETGEELGVDLRINQEENDEIEKISGFELMYGFTDEGFATEEDRMSLIYEDVAILAIRGKVHNSDKEVITNIIKGVTEGIIGNTRYENYHRRPLIICADSFSENIIAHVLAMKDGRVFTRKNTDPNSPYDTESISFPVALFAMSCMQGTPEQEKFYDFVTAVGATPVDAARDKLIFNNIHTVEGFKNSVVAILGHAKKVEGTMYGTKFFGGNGKPEEIKARIEHIEKVIDSQHANSTYGINLSPVNELRSRIAMLNRKMSRIKIGGINIKEKQRRKTVYDDVVRSVQSTIRYQGYVLGGNVNIHWSLIRPEIREKIAKTITENLIADRKNIISATKNQEAVLESIVNTILLLVGKAFTASYKYTLMNAFNWDEKIVDTIFESIHNCKTEPSNYNILTGRYAILNDSELIVPMNTDPELMRAIFTIMKDLLTSGLILMFNPMDVRFKDNLRFFGKY